MRTSILTSVAAAAMLCCGTAQADGVLGGLLKQVSAAGSAAQSEPTAWFGVTVSPAPGMFGRSKVVSVEPGSPAEAAGLRPGDELAGVYKAPRTLLSTPTFLGDQSAIEKWLATPQQQPGAAYELAFVRGGVTQKAQLTLAALPARAKLASAHDQLCKPGAAQASAATCAALKADAAKADAAKTAAAPAAMAEAAAPEQAYLQRQLDAAREEQVAFLKAQITGLEAGKPAYKQMTVKMAADIKGQATDLKKKVAALGALLSIEHQRTEGGTDYYLGRHTGGYVEWRLSRAADGKLAGLWFEPQPMRNAYRGPDTRKAALTLLHAGAKDPFVDDLRPGETFRAIAEKSDKSRNAFKSWEDCYRLNGVAGRSYKFSTYSHGQPATVQIGGSCDWDKKVYQRASGADFGLRYVQPADGSPAYALVMLTSPVDHLYEVDLYEMSPDAISRWQAEIRQAELEAERARQQAAAAKAQQGNSGAWGALLFGAAVAAAGGNSEQVMGAAMQGAAMTTDNDMSRQIYADAGQQMFDAGAQRAQAEHDANLRRIQAEADARARQEAAAREEQFRRDQEATARANARQEAERVRLAGEIQQAEQDRADRQTADAARRAEVQRQAEQRRLADQQRLAEEKRLADAKRQAEAERLAEEKRQAEQKRLAELKRKQDEAARPVAFKEGVVLCKQQKAKYWRCDGPLQFDYGDIDSPALQRILGNACGGNLGIHDLGTTGGYRAFGCGFGIHPTNRQYPGNRDVPADFGVYVANRGTYYCPQSKDAYCRG